ncbi:MAG: ABC transporter permease [Actinomycetota bacterium]
MPRAVRRLTGPALLVVVWWLITAAGWVDHNTFPRPGDVADLAWEMTRSGELGSSLWASLRRVLAGTSIGVSAGVLLAVLAGLSRVGDDLLDSTMQVLKAIPTIALTPLFIIWMGIDEGPKIVLIALSTSLPIYINTYGAIRNVDTRLVDTGRTLGLSQAGLVRHVVLPGALPGFLTGLRISLTNAWIALVVAEQVNAHEGLGRLMADARSFFRLDLMVLVIVIYAVLGLLSYALVRFLERHLLQWRRGFEGT